MPPVVGCGGAEAGRGIAIHAAKQARVVDPDIAALNASTGRSLCSIFPRAHLDLEDAPDQIVINTLPPFHAIGHQVHFLRTAHDFHAIRGTNLCQPRDEPVKFFTLRLAEMDTM
jgi:hypothetical protein